MVWNVPEFIEFNLISFLFYVLIQKVFLNLILSMDIQLN